MQVNLYALYTTYLVNMFATLNNLNLKMQECNHSSIAFKIAALRWWHLYQKHGVSPHTRTFIGEEPGLISGKNHTLVLKFFQNPNPPS